ncbi:response regulator transcription factor [Actinoplanes sp. NPDC051494]|uniref:response regulator transcription factor n=1 Tax=Actinoplanes sp. NPDC051494 TaxID=3363907 RepID=UPI0037B5594E
MATTTPAAPVPATALAAAMVPAAGLAAATVPAAVLTAATVLVADDDPDIRDLIGLKLRTAGYTVLSADNGTTALDLAERHLPDIVILDVAMPGLTGFGVCYQLQTLRATVKIPVIILSSLDNDDDITLGYTIGADDYLIKPVVPGDLVQRVQALLTH